MPKLNRDLLREVFYEIIKDDGFKNIDKFMMAGKEEFKLVLDCCKKANDVIIFKHEIVAKFPAINYNNIVDGDSNSDRHEEHVPGTIIPTNMLFIKPISKIFASIITSLDIRSFFPALIPMVKAIKHEINEIIIYDTDCYLNDFLDACSNIPNVQNCVTIWLSSYSDKCIGCKFDISSFVIPCRKLTLINVYFNTAFEDVNISNPHLHNIRDLTIVGTFQKTGTMYILLKHFAAFLKSNFPNLESLNVKFVFKVFSDTWYWNVYNMADIFLCLPRGIKGCICFKIVTEKLHVQIDHAKYPNVQKNRGDEYYKIFPITKTLNFKLAQQSECRVMPLIFD